MRFEYLVQLVLHCVDSADKTTTVYCNVTLSEQAFQAFVYAVKNHYWYQMYIDDLPIWGMTNFVLVSRTCFLGYGRFML